MAEKRSRASGQGKSFGDQKTTPKGGVIREGWRGEGADQRIVVKRLKLTPGETHRAEYETCDQEDCSSSKRCKQCAKFTKKNIQNARAKSLPGMDEKERQEKNRKRREEYNRMGEKERQEKNKKRREEYKPYMPIKSKADKGDVDAQWRLAWAYADGKLGLDKDDQMAFNYFQMMAEKKDCRALWRRALAYKHGVCEPLFKALLADKGVDPNITQQDGFTALICAALLGHAPVVTLLLADERVDPNIADQDSDTALMFAALHGHASVVTLLLADERVDPNLANKDGNTALYLPLIKSTPRW